MIKAIEDLFDLTLPTNSFPSIIDNKIVFIYGAGNFGKDVFRVLINYGIVVSGFIDRAALPNSNWNGVPIYLPDDDLLPAEMRENSVLILAIHNRDVEMMAVLEKLRGLSYRRIITPIELYDHFNQELGERYWLTARSAYQSLKKVVVDGASLWEDEPSRQLYLSTLAFRMSGDYSLLQNPDRDNQYVPPDLPGWEQPLRLVDCGAFDGDTLVNLQMHQLQIEAVAAFEPDQANFQKLSVFAKNFLAKDISLWPCAVYSSTCRLLFSGEGEGGRLSPDQGVMVQCAALDDVLPGFQPNLIKMDIEGSEYEALLGARSLIKEHLPGLAICVYHRPAHLWQIPMLIRSWHLGYRFYLRSHANNGFEMVLYAISNR